MYIPAEHPLDALTSVGLDSASLAGRDGLAVIEIAGRDSVAAGVAAVRDRGFSALLPTSVATATEYGDEDAPRRAAMHLASLLGDAVEVLPHVRIGSPALWAALNSRYSAELSRRFGPCSPCLACHLYMHLARVPLAWALGNVPVIAGERDSHGGRLKLSQTPIGIDASVRVLAFAGIELLEPIRRVRDSGTISGLVGPGWTAGAKQLRCVHSGNYVGIDGAVTYDELAYARYVRGFLEPVGTAVIRAWRISSEVDYDELVRRQLSGPNVA